ncbi:MAG TPA: isoprenylcysteine carboxylmethyltransferase family protein [Gammaproteobacteria bacterium]|nr:isoprenylcysteine carboxylmethyltransferase family protein [Gammaproteobacteria bacterium]
MSRIGLPRPWVIAYGNWLFKYRNAVFPLVMLTLFLGFRPVLWRGDLAMDARLDGLGLAVALLGQGLRAAVIGYAYIKRGGVNKRIHADQLVTQGLFAHARNPLYDGNLLILMGLFIIHNHPAVYILGGVYFVTAYIAIVAAEEEFLSGKFGDAYHDYCRKVPRWLPNLRGLRQTLSEMEFNWRRVVIKDYASAYTWMMTALLIFAYEDMPPAGWGVQRGRLVLSLAVALTLVFIVVRYMKKRRLLRESL